MPLKGELSLKAAEAPIVLYLKLESTVYICLLFSFILALLLLSQCNCS